MTNLVNKSDYEDLFYDFGDDHELTAEEFYTLHPDPVRVFELEKKKMVQLQKGIESLIDAEFPWETIVIEGIAITPEFIDQIKSKFPSIKMRTIFLYEDSDDRMRKRLYSRGLYDSPDKYAEWVKPLELLWVKLYNDYYKEECAKFSMELTPLNRVNSLDFL